MPVITIRKQTIGGITRLTSSHSDGKFVNKLTHGHFFLTTVVLLPLEENKRIFKRVNIKKSWHKIYKCQNWVALSQILS